MDLQDEVQVTQQWLSCARGQEFLSLPAGYLSSPKLSLTVRKTPGESWSLVYDGNSKMLILVSLEGAAQQGK